MKISLISLADSLDGKIDDVVAWIFSEGPAAERYMLNEQYGTPFVEKSRMFESFEKDTHGGLASTGVSTVSWMSGRINGKRVMFVHPTSNMVDYAEITSALKEIKNIPVIEGEYLYYLLDEPAFKSMEPSL